MKNALRIGHHRYYREDHFREHLAFVEKNLDTIDEITLFAEFSHYGYWPLDWSAENAAILRDRIARYREVGVRRVGINLLCTVGHLNEGWDVLPRAPFPYQVKQNGEESRAQLCFMNEAFLDHVAKRYALYAATGADFIWMDDDIRIEGNGCFCDGCVERFNRRFGGDRSREEVTALIETDPEAHALWREIQHEGMTRVIRTVRESVHAVDPRVEVGYMSIDGNCHRDWIDESGTSMARPGGGFYDERAPLEVLEKYFRVQQQISKYPDRVTDIQYEYEAFNYQTLNRSARFSELEITLMLMAGCTGALYNNDIFYDRQDFVDMLARSTPKWISLTHRNKDCKPVGVYCTSRLTARFLCELGIPVTASLEQASVSALLGKDMEKLSDGELARILQKSVFTDGLGVETLTRRGFGEACGASISRVYESGMAERFGTHAFNGDYANYYRDVFMSFSYYVGNKGFVYEFAPAEGAEEISRLETITHEARGCSLYACERADSNRFAADGYLFQQSAQTHAKCAQISNLIDWLSGGRLPVRVITSGKVVPCMTANENGGVNLMLMNMSFDESGRVNCRIRAEGEFRVIAPDGGLFPVDQLCVGGETLVMLPSIPAWDYVLLTNVR